MAAVVVGRRTSGRREARLAVGSFAGRGVGAAAVLLWQVVAVRLLDVRDVSRFGVALALVMVAAVLGRLGMDTLVLRDAAVAAKDGNLPDVYRGAIRLTLAASIGLTVLLLVTASQLTGTLGDGLAAPLRVGALAVPPLALLAVQGELVKGAGRPVLGSVMQSVLNPAAALLLIVLFRPASASGVLWMVAAGAAVAAVASHVVVRRLIAGIGPAPATGRWRPSGVLTFGAASLWQLGIVWSPILVLGQLATDEDVARYFAADRIAQLGSLVLLAVNAVVGPRAAAAWAVGDRPAVRRLLRRSGRASALLAAVLAAGMVVLAAPALGVFGGGYEDASTVLRVLAIGQFVVLATGPVSVVAAMVGEERLVHRAGAVALTLQVLGLALFVPVHGAVGAALATTAALAINKAVISTVVNRRIAMAPINANGAS